MALADYGFETTFEGSIEDAPFTLSLEEAATRKGYVVRPSAAASGLKSRIYRMVMASLLASIGSYLLVQGDTLVSPDTVGGWLLAPIGLYLIASGLFWMTTLLRRQQELEINHRDRCFHLIKRDLRGQEANRQTIRFEEVVKISMIDDLAALDMRASALNWAMGRIDITWRQNKVTPLVVGDVAELEPLLKRLRREVGMA